MVTGHHPRASRLSEIRFTALTAKTRFVLQAVCWTDTNDPASAPGATGLEAEGNKLVWQLGDPDTSYYPHGNSIGMVISDGGRTRRQLEIVIDTTPGETYMVKWSMGGEGFVLTGTRWRLQANVYSA